MEIIDLDNVLSKFEIPLHINRDLLEIPIAGDFLKKYCLLTYHADLWKNFHADIIFYNRYYWFCQFLATYREKYGKDAGLEQQAFQILEEVQNIHNIDWQIIEKIQKQICTS